jgi:hypothetical protein
MSFPRMVAGLVVLTIVGTLLDLLGRGDRR